VYSLAGKLLYTTLLLDPDLSKKFLVGIPRRYTPFRIYHPDLNRRPLNPYRMRNFKVKDNISRTRWLERIHSYKLKLFTSCSTQLL
jgi:hypothetical protein